MPRPAARAPRARPLRAASSAAASALAASLCIAAPLMLAAPLGPAAAQDARATDDAALSVGPPGSGGPLSEIPVSLPPPRSEQKARTTQQGSGEGLSGLLADEQQDGPVSLVADHVTYDAERATLTASGNVEVYYGRRTLTASRIVYDRRADRVAADGPMTLRGPEGVVVLADFAELDARLRDGLIRGARAVMPGEAKFAAAEGRRIDGRYNVLSRAVFSPCRVCLADPTPLWRIRAERIVHDEQERTVHYEDATFDVLGQPVFWTPYFRHPDPTLERASGFLPPEYLQSSTFGHAIKQPYYWVIDDQTDATVAPFFTTDDGFIAEGEFRRRFEGGSLWLQGSATYQDYDGSNLIRGHLFGEGLWELRDGLEAGFRLEQASDDGYLRRYEFSEDDRLESEAFLRAADETGWGEISVVRFQSLRDNEPFGQIPMALPAFEGRRVYHDLSPIGGAVGFELAGYALKRTDGQDTVHGFAAADWERTWVHGATGLQATALGRIRADTWQLNDLPPGAADQFTRIAPVGVLDLRLPLVRRDADGDFLSPLLGDGPSTQLLEPIAQFVAAPYFDDRPAYPNEDSTIVEFDETSLFAIRRHPGYDGFEEGPRLNLGLRWSRLTETGPKLSAAAGRVFRFKEIGSFPRGVGLDGRESDYVGAWSIEVPGRIKLAHRMRVADDLDIRRNEVYAEASWLGLDIAGSYVFLAQDAVTPMDRHEVTAEARYALTPNWFVGTELRRDLQSERWVHTEGLIGYANECVDLAFYFGRRFTSTDDVPASTFFGARVNLWALGGAGGPAAPSSACTPQLE